jgi:putative intracellular protease/amidase
MPSGESTGWYLPEVAHPYYALREGGYAVDFASTRGGSAPVDPASLTAYLDKDEESTKFWHDASLRASLNATADVHGVDLGRYGLVFLAGGNGPMWDIAPDVKLGQMLSGYLARGGYVGAVCHGPAGLLHVKDVATDAPLLRGLPVTCFTNEEEAVVGMDGKVPFLLESRLREAGASFTSTGSFSCHVVPVPAKRIVTGQNPNSARPCAAALVAMAAGGNPAAVAAAAEDGDYIAAKLPPAGPMPRATVISGETLATTTARALDTFAMK